MSGIKDHKKHSVRASSRTGSGQRRGSSTGTARRTGTDPARRTGSASSRSGAGARTSRPAGSGQRGSREQVSREAVRANQRRYAQQKRRSNQKNTGKVKRSIRPSAGQRLMRRLPAIVTVIAVLLVIYGGLTFKHWLTVRQYDKNKIADNIRIGTIDVSGKTEKEAKEILKKELKEAREQTVTLNIEGESEETTLKDLGLSIKDYKKLPARALAYGSSGSVNKRYKKLKGLKKETYVVPLTYQLDKSKAGAVLDTLCTSIEDSPVNASLEIEGKKISVVEGEEGMVADTDKIAANIENKLNDKWDKDELSVNVATKKSSPKVKAKDLEAVKDELGSYETSFEGSDAGRAANIELGCSMINGSIVMPGETFSADAAMRPYTEERGWEEAASYENGDIVDSLGGGVCQISSTLYNAVLYAELEVVQRQPHSRRVSYVEPGRDAAIAGDVKDFKFKNNTKDPVYIYGKVSGQTLMFAIYGKDTREENRKITFESEVLETSDFTTVYKGSDDPVGQMYISASGHEGMTAKLWKTVTVDGKESEPEEVNQSEYLPQDTIINVGMAGTAGQANLIAAAIRTQNEAEIRKAIAAAASY